MQRKDTRTAVAWLVVQDAIALAVGFLTAWLVRFRLEPPTTVLNTTDLVIPSAFATAIWIVSFATHGLYNTGNIWNGATEYSRVARASTVAVVAVGVATFLLGPLGGSFLDVSRSWLMLSWLLGLLAVGIGRFAFRRVIFAGRRQGRFVRNCLIVGANEQALVIARQLQGNPTSDLRVVGFVDEFLAPGTPLVNNTLHVVGGPSHLESLIREHQVDEFIVVPQAVTWETMQELGRLSVLDNGSKVKVSLATGWYDLLASGVRAERRGNVPLLTPELRRITGIDALFKSAIDYGISLLLTVTVLPVVLLWHAVTKPADVPLLERIPIAGRRGQRVDMFVLGGTAVNGQVPLGVGRLPGLLNVLRRQLSLVGPRPLPLGSEATHEWAPLLLSVRPGLVGLMPQGTSTTVQDVRAAIDLWYVRNYSIWLDVQALWTAFLAFISSKPQIDRGDVVGREGAQRETAAQG